MKHILKKKLTAILTAVFAMSMVMPTASVFAASGDSYLALGADLSDSERATVLELLGVDGTEGYNVIDVTNAEEHQYLGKYVSSAEIGKRALSSVLIKENSSDEIHVETKNINYCTTGMYRNALATAGVSGADVTVVGPFEISGTAALVGTIKAYEKMTGEEVSDEVIEGSVGELTTTGEVGEELGDQDAAEGIIAKVKEEMADNPDMTDEEIREAILQAASEAGVDIDDSTVDKIARMLEELQGLDIDWGNVKSQSESILENFRGLFHSEEAKGFFSRIVQWFKNLF